MKKSMQFIARSFFALAGFVALQLSPALAPLAHAATTPAATTSAAAPEPAAASVDSCTITPADLAALQAIQTNPSLTSSEELTQELALRKQLLAETITCANNDAKSLEAAVDAASPGAGGMAIQSTLSGKFDDAIAFYAIEAAKVNGAGIKATEAIAKEMSAWREANYVPLEGDANNFLIWSDNQTLFGTAQNRLTQTQRVVSFIENAGGGSTGDLASGISAAESSFNNAASLNLAAGAALAELQPPDQSLALIQQSLQSLADAYQKFTDLNTLIQKLLPTGGQ